MDAQPHPAPSELSERLVEVPCVKCGVTFTARHFTFPGLGRTLGDTVCPGCVDSRRLATERAKLSEREEKWQRHCPAAYRDCDPERLPTDAARTVLQKALSWEPETTRGGLGIVGRKSGQGKTRILYAAVRPHFLAGSGFRAVNCGVLGTDISASVGAALRELLRPLKRVSLLLLDDLGKERATPHVAAALYSVVEERTAHGLPILFTANFSGDELAEKLGEHGPFIVRRLREHTDSFVV